MTFIALGLVAVFVLVALVARLDRQPSPDAETLAAAQAVRDGGL